MKDGSSRRMVLRVQALNFNLKARKNRSSIIYGYQRFLNSLRFPIQIIVRSLKVDIESYLLKLKESCPETTKHTSPRTNLSICGFFLQISSIWRRLWKRSFTSLFRLIGKKWRPLSAILESLNRFANFWAAITSEEKCLHHTRETTKHGSAQKRKFRASWYYKKLSGVYRIEERRAR